jgi:hypothetical protein
MTIGLRSFQSTPFITIEEATRLFVDVSEQPADEHRRANQADDDTDGQHDHRDAETKALWVSVTRTFPQRREASQRHFHRGLAISCRNMLEQPVQLSLTAIRQWRDVGSAERVEIFPTYYELFAAA